jgi:hypothetical protein
MLTILVELHYDLSSCNSVLETSYHLTSAELLQFPTIKYLHLRFYTAVLTKLDPIACNMHHVLGLLDKNSLNGRKDFSLRLLLDSQKSEKSQRLQLPREAGLAKFQTSMFKRRLIIAALAILRFKLLSLSTTGLDTSIHQ